MTKKWSKDVTENSHALSLDKGVFTWKNPKKIAQSLQHSAETSKNRNSSPFRSAMSMLSFYINRGGKILEPDQKKILEKAMVELRKLYRK